MQNEGTKYLSLCIFFFDFVINASFFQTGFDFVSCPMIINKGNKIQRDNKMFRINGK